MKKTTQTKAILKHLQDGKTITPIDALNLYGCFRLSARIHDIRSMGYDVKNTGGKYAVYSLSTSKVA